MPFAFTRPVSPRLGQCELTHLDRQPIDVAEAANQHRRYEAALSTCGWMLERLPPLDRHPDGVFVEDTAILLGEHAILTRPGVASRVAETETVAEALARHLTVHRLVAGRLDGGDVLQIGRTLYVGLGPRTDREGGAALAAMAGRLGWRVEPVAIRGCLHLKTAATYAGLDGAGRPVLVVNPAWVDPTRFGDLDPVLAVEPFGANTLRLGKRLLVAAAAEATNRRLADRGFTLMPVEISELAKAEAGLTCLSLIQPEVEPA